MSMLRKSHVSPLLALALATAAAASGCGDKGGYKGGKKSAALKWLESPKNGAQEGNFLKIPSLGAQLEIPETRYVFKNCEEPTHAPEGPDKWVPVFRCSSEGSGGDELGDGGDQIAMTFYLAKKERPIDERSVAFFENELREKGYKIDDIAFNDSYHDKRGIYFKFQEVDENETPTREIVRFMFPYDDVVFIAAMEYPFGDSRSINTDWSAIMWYFKFQMPGGA